MIDPLAQALCGKGNCTCDKSTPDQNWIIHNLHFDSVTEEIALLTCTHVVLEAQWSSVGVVLAKD
jgi:hypothetical protein